jgi:phosphoribosylanthranilate isomerase
MSHRTRIKICGLSRAEHVHAAVAAGADAIGLVFYPPSPRYVAPEVAARLISAMPPYVASVGLFVNATQQEVEATVKQAPVSLLQFHGDETIEQCCTIAHAVARPFVRAIRIGPDMDEGDLLKYEQDYRAASTFFSGLLLDALVDGYGGGGKVFDWSLIPKELGPRVVLSGGLSAQNVADAMRQMRPHAVDVSSGVELSRGVKDAVKIRSFIEAIRQADALMSD